MIQGQQIVEHINEQLKKLSKSDPGKTVCIDFDSVVAYHEKGDPLDKIGKPLDPGIAIIKTAKKLGLKPVILTARPQQFHGKMEAFLQQAGAAAPVTNVKPPALMYIDDLAERYPANFDGKLESFETEAMENGGDGSMNMLDGHHYKSLATHESLRLREHGVKGQRWGIHKPRDISGWEKIGGQKGSNPGGLYQAPDGTKYYVKFNKTEEQNKSEILANSIYNELAIPAPQSTLVSDGTHEGVASPWMEDAKSTTKTQQVDNVDVQNGFVADAFLANHDVMGLNYDNIVNNDGKFVRIDNGGSMFFRASGLPKYSFTPSSVPELDNMRDPGIAKQAGSIFQNISEKDIQKQSDFLVGALSDKRIGELVEQAGFTGKEAEKYEAALKGRRDYIKNDTNKGKEEHPEDEMALAAIGKTPYNKEDEIATGQKSYGLGDDSKAAKGKTLKQTFLDKTSKEGRAGGYFLNTSTIGKLYNSLAKTQGDWTKITDLEAQHGGKTSIKNRISTLKAIGNWTGKWSVEVSGGQVRFFENKGSAVVKDTKSQEQSEKELGIAGTFAKVLVDAQEKYSNGQLPDAESRYYFGQYFTDMGVSAASRTGMESCVRRWTGSVNSEEGQKLRAVAMEFYGRQAKDEYTGSNTKIIGKPETNIKEIKDAVLAQKAYASEYARQKGITTVYRGVSGPAADNIRNAILKDGEVRCPLNSLSSWSESKSKARSFGHGGVLLKLKVDPDNIWAVHSAAPFLFSAHALEQELIVGHKQPFEKFKKEDVELI